MRADDDDDDDADDGSSESSRVLLNFLPPMPAAGHSLQFGVEPNTDPTRTRPQRRAAQWTHHSSAPSYQAHQTHRMMEGNGRWDGMEWNR